MKPQTPMPKIKSNHKPQFPKIRALDSWDFLGHWSLVIGSFKNTKYKIQHTTYNKGYALMLSIVVSSVVLSIGLSLLNIVQKELILSATGRDSQFAFYAADSGVECALYWGDTHARAFPLSGAEWLNGEPSAPGMSGDDDCGNTDFGNDAWWNAELNNNGTNYTCGGPPCADPPVYTGHEDDVVIITFQIQFADATAESPGSCAKVTITTTGNGVTGNGYDTNTKIDSRGYNAACPAGGGDFDADANPRLVERAISVSY